jgi:hypothetical protein
MLKAILTQVAALPPSERSELLVALKTMDAPAEPSTTTEPTHTVTPLPDQRARSHFTTDWGISDYSLAQQAQHTHQAPQSRQAQPKPDPS